ncbi:MAG TPA: TldD/PmbA family protein [Atribacteraceae bacterium]|nr:TldD/PmbA family protein [Atribacteraceae bacterium]
MDDIFSGFRKTGLSGDCYIETTAENRIEYEAGECRGYTVREDRGFGLRLIDSQRRMGFFSSNDFTAVPEAFERAAAISRHGNEAGFDIPSYAQIGSWEDRIDKRVVAFHSGELTEIGDYITHRVRKEFPEVLINLTLSAGKQEKKLVNHREESIGYTRTFFHIAIEVNRTRDNDILEISTDYGWGNRDINIEDFLQELFFKLERSQKIVTVESGAYPVLFTPSGSMVLFYPLLHGLNGKNIVYRRSPLEGKLHQALFSPLLTLKEINHEMWSLGSAPFDDEGVETIPERKIIEEGKLESYFLDLWAAEKGGFPASSGGYRHSYRELPEPGFGSLMLECGLRDRETLIEEMERGLIVDSVLGLGQSNVAGGHFSCNVQLGFLVEGGIVQGRVKDLMISGNVYQVLQGVREISRDNRWIHGRMLLPCMLVEPVQVDSSLR